LTPQRLFFALWPPPLVGVALAALIARLPPLTGHVVCPDDWHLTLAFIGACEPARRDGLLAAATVTAPPFALQLDECGVFADAGVAWAGCSRPPSGLDALHIRLCAALAGCGWQPPARPFVPHVTLARQCSRWPAVPQTPCDWPVQDFVLAESLPGTAMPRYAVLARWPLTGANA
jgi:2'-5' RNA ligase